MLPSYNAKTDYISAHLQFANKHKNFQPKGFVLPQNNYYEVLNEQYKLESFTNETPEQIFERKNKLAFHCYQMDLSHEHYYRQVELSLMMENTGPQISFVTIGFNHQEFTPAKGLEFIRTVLGLSIINENSFGVMEVHRENGEHPHCHLKVFHDKKSKKSSLVQTIFRAKNGRKLVLSKNFIDVKPFYPHHEDYLQGNKKAEKLKFVEKDIEWRKKNNIPEKVFK